MKRDEREDDGGVQRPGPRRKARLQAQATYMMRLPREIRAMIMMKLEPYQQYILYNEVDDMRFKEWCDRDFWNYALDREFAGTKIETPHMASNPRWQYFTYVVHRTMFKSHDEVTFQRDLPDGTFERIDEMHALERGTGFAFNLSVNLAYVIPMIVNAQLKTRGRIPMITISTIDDGGYLEYRMTLEMQSNRFAFELIYMFFSKGFSWRIMIAVGDDDGEYAEDYSINCHICGKTATGYVAEDPSKLLCGPRCK
jgi:hypothetical protein